MSDAMIPVRISGIALSNITQDVLAFAIFAGLVYWRVRPVPPKPVQQDRVIGGAVDPKRGSHDGSQPMSWVRGGFVNYDPVVKELYGKLL